jgi:integrase
MQETHEILGGKALIFRVKASGDIWQFRMWIAEEKKYLRKTLQTTDTSTAIKRAETKYLEIYSDVKTGKKIFGITLSELIFAYIAWRSKDVAGGKITSGRLLTIQSQLRNLVRYKSKETKISGLDRSSLYDYAQWRRTDKSKTQDVTIRNEQVTFNHMIAYAYRNGLAHFDKFNFQSIKIKDIKTRDIFSLNEYDDLVKYLRVWVSNKQKISVAERLHRLLIRDCILIASNTMLRVGELWQLRWKDIEKYEELSDESGRKVTIVTLNVRAEIAKTRRSRKVTTRGGEYLQRLHSRAEHKSKNDFIFCGKSGDVRLPKMMFYDAWADLMRGIGIEYKERNLTWYSLRHFGITCRLKAGASVFDISKIAGTGVTNIEQRYGHFDQSMARSVALKNFSFSRDGISSRVEHGE